MVMAVVEEGDADCCKSGKRNLESRRCKKMSTRCFPGKMHSVVSHLDDEMKDMIKVMGFGKLLDMKKCFLRMDLIAWLVERFEPTNASLQLHEQEIHLNSGIFASVIGISDDGEDLVVNDVVENCNSYTSGRISVNDLQKKLESGEEKEFFIRNFIMFFLSSFLMPTTSLFVVRSIEEYCNSINEVSSVRGRNWASISFKFLVDSICRFKEIRGNTAISCYEREYYSKRCIKLNVQQPKRIEVNDK